MSRTWALSAGLSWVAALGACGSAPSVGRTVYPFESLSEKQREEVEAILADPSAVVTLEQKEVRSRPEVYDFLLSEMEFTGGVVRELNRGKWDIYRHPDKPEANVFYLKDPEGIWLRFEQIHRDETRRFYVTHGFFDMGLLPRLEGKTFIVMSAVPRGDVIVTDAVVTVKVVTPFYAKLVTAMRTLLERKVREKSGYFIEAATWVAEQAAERPEWLHSQVRGSTEVDPDALERFRKILVH